MTRPSESLARAVLAALIDSGVREVVYCPGSRSAPIAYSLDAAVRAGLLRAHVRLDERSAGFLAIGLSRAGRPAAEGQDPAASPRPVPVALVTTSGGAVAELHAAVAEAHHSRLPLVVLSADRPAELRGVGASQTTTQLGIFGPHARASLDLPADTLADRSLAARVGRIIARAEGLPSGTPGPVHINLSLRDPLTPEGGSLAAPPFPVGTPRPARVLPARAVPVPWEEAVLPGLRTILLAGDGSDAGAGEWASAARIPVLAEPTSPLAFHPLRMPHEQSLLSSALAERIEQVVVTGRPTLSRPVSALLARSGLRIVVVDPSNEWTDVAGSAALVVPALAPLAHEAADPAGPAPSSAWLAHWRALAEATGEVIERVLARAPLSVLHVAEAVWRADSRTLLLGASNSVRAADLVGCGGAPRRVVSNRGLAGIDGTLATAIGLALGTGEAVTALMGDLTFLHDAGALAVPSDEAPPALLVLVADDAGGGIFAGLEHGAEENAPTFERWFATPQPTSIAALARAYGAQFREITSIEELEAVLAEPLEGVRVCRIACARPGEINAVRRAANEAEVHSSHTDEFQY